MSPAHTVPNEYVHKTTAAEVLLTGWRATGQDTFTVTASWPTDHPFYEPVRGFHDPMLVAETVRQMVPLLSHLAYDVPFGHRQSWSRFRYSLSRLALATGDAPTDVELRVTCTDVARRGTVLAGMAMHVELFAGGTALGTACSTFRNHAPAIYRRLRGERADSAWSAAQAAPVLRPVPPQRVGRHHEKDVVIASGVPQLPDSRLRIDTRHPVLFDHPLDHVPGMLLLEAARQAGNAVAGPLGAGPQHVIATTFDAVFTRYVEFDAPCRLQSELVSAAANGSSRVGVSAVQNDECVFSATVGFESLSTS